MGVQKKLIVLFFNAGLTSLILPLVCSSHEHQKIIGNHLSNKDHNPKMNPRLLFEIKVHGFLLWASMGFLMPVGIIAIRLSNREKNQRRVKIIFYVHAVLQNLAVIVATAGAILSIKNFNNLFNNTHQRVGVALYGTIWLQLLLGIFRPKRGSRRRKVWFFSHWIIGTAVSLLGVFSVYLGLQAFKEKTSKSVALWNILFTAQVSLIVFFYLFQDKWVYIHSQGEILGNEPPKPTCQDETKQMELKAESC